MHRAYKHLRNISGMMLVLTFVSCTTQPASLTGTVNYRGKQLLRGSVSIVGNDGQPRSTTILPNGKFRFEGLTVGLNKIAITSPDPVKSVPIPRKKELAVPVNQVDRSNWFPIPETYGDFSTSNQSSTLIPGENTLEIRLE